MKKSIFFFLLSVSSFTVFSSFPETSRFEVLDIPNYESSTFINNNTAIGETSFFIALTSFLFHILGWSSESFAITILAWILGFCALLFGFIGFFSDKKKGFAFLGFCFGFISLLHAFLVLTLFA